jgi:hypothetical protein
LSIIIPPTQELKNEGYLRLQFEGTEPYPTPIEPKYGEKYKTTKILKRPICKVSRNFEYDMVSYGLQDTRTILNYELGSLWIQTISAFSWSNRKINEACDMTGGIQPDI